MTVAAALRPAVRIQLALGRVEGIRPVAVLGKHEGGILTETLRRVGFALGGEGGARIARVFRIFTSPDTVLRIIRGTHLEPASTPRVLGMDDWALRKGHNYGTILVDQERHQPVDLLPDREAETVAVWLEAHQGVEIITRDRGETYLEGATKGAPNAIQIADRWHLTHNLGEAVQKMFERHPAELRAAAQKMYELTHPSESSAVETPTDSPTCAAPPSQTRRQYLFNEVKALAAQGYSKRAIALQLHMHRATVDRYIHVDELPQRRPPQTVSSVTPYLPYIEQRWEEGCRTIQQLWQEIQAQGYTGSYSSVRRALRRFQSGDARRNPKSSPPPPRPLSPRQAKGLLVRTPEELTNDQNVYRQVLCDCCEDALAVYSLAQRFMTMIKMRQADALDAWLEDAESCTVPQLRNFVVRLRQDYAAIKVALTYDWSNEQTEGQVNRLKTIKRQMYGRAKFDLLRQRVLYDDS